MLLPPYGHEEKRYTKELNNWLMQIYAIMQPPWQRGNTMTVSDETVLMELRQKKILITEQARIQHLRASWPRQQHNSQEKFVRGSGLGHLWPKLSPVY